MSELTMKKAQREAFLADLHVGVVTVEGPVVIGDTDDDVQRSLAHRYLGPAIGDLYLGAIADTVSRVARLTPTRWRTVDYTPFVERVAGASSPDPDRRL